MIANRCESSNRVTEDNQKSNWTQLVINAIIFPRRHFGQTNCSKKFKKLILLCLYPTHLKAALVWTTFRLSWFDVGLFPEFPDIWTTFYSLGNRSFLLSWNRLSLASFFCNNKSFAASSIHSFVTSIISQKR